MTKKTIKDADECPKCGHPRSVLIGIQHKGDGILVIERRCYQSNCQTRFTHVCELVYTKVFSAKPEE